MVVRILYLFYFTHIVRILKQIKNGEYFNGFS